MQYTECNKKPSYALIAMGSSLSSAVGRPKQTLLAAIEKLKAFGFEVESVSEFYRTPCFPAGAGPDYVNAVLRVRVDIPADEVLAVLHQVEEMFGRTRELRWGARSLDLDLLDVDQKILPNEKTFSDWKNLDFENQKTDSPKQLILPHPRIQDRAFVLIPLSDVAPDWRHPVLGKTVAEMLDVLPSSELAAIKALKTK